MDSEKSRLLVPSAPPPEDGPSAANIAIVSPLSAEDYGQTATRPYYGTPTIPCKVCRSPINIDGKLAQHVVKCPACNEATPLKPPPVGRKYVRCPCNCLLVCKSTAQKISCPRPNCRRVIKLVSAPTETQRLRTPGTASVVCGHCRHPFLFNIVANALAKCPHCHKSSSVGTSYAHRRAVIYGLIALVFVALTIVSIVVTADRVRTQTGFIALYVGLGVIALILIGRATKFALMKISQIQSLI